MIDYVIDKNEIGTNHYQPYVYNPNFWSSMDEKFLTGSPERNCIDRLKVIDFNITDYSGSLLDIGCNIGFFCHYFAEKGLNTHGVDNDNHVKTKKFTDKGSIETANRLKEIYKHDNSLFTNVDYLSILDDNTNYDYIIYLSVWHHHFYGYSHNKNLNMFTKEKNIAILDKIINKTKKILFFEYDHKSITSYISVDELQKYLNDRGDIEFKIQNNIEQSQVKTTYQFNRNLYIITKK
jgi:2-polyprenyl-3-methyl-5-hydroxy-6-metoxy-1,4-benzoquinol methylase